MICDEYFTSAGFKCITPCSCVCSNCKFYKKGNVAIKVMKKHYKVEVDGKLVKTGLSINVKNEVGEYLA